LQGKISNMKVMIIGGHMAPALGLLHAVPKNWDIVYVGRKHVFEGDLGTSLEYETIKKKSIRFIPFTTGRLQRRLTTHTIPSLVKIPQGFFSAVLLLKKEKPDVVVGFGGYLSVPFGFAARLQDTPFLIHESTLHAGLANKILAPIAKKVCISWDSSRIYFPKSKTVLTGDPLLPFNEKIPKNLLPKSSESLPLLFIAGGSGGSHAVNTIIFNCLEQLVEKFRIIHQTGAAQEFGDYEKLLEKKKQLPKKLQERYAVMQFITPDVVNSVFALADIFIGRSGVNTVATLMLLKKKCILIPLSVGQKDEQLENAKLLQSAGLGIIIDQDTLSSDILLEKIQELLEEDSSSVSKWEIPVITNGAENLMKEVFVCAKSHHQEK